MKKKTKVTLAKVQLVFWNYWLATLCEFHGPLKAFSGSFLFFLDGSSYSRDEYRRKYKKLLNYIYGDYSDKKLYPGCKLPIVYLHTLLIYSGKYNLALKLPAEYRVLNEKYTDKVQYYFERKAYRGYNRIAKDGYDLKKYAYDEYKLIAAKYNWPILYNSDD